jgi:hypothetical protein
MKRNIFLVIISLPFSSFVLKPVFYIRNNIKIQHLLVLPPVSAIAVIQKGNKFQNDDELSKQTFYSTSNQLKKCMPESVNHEYFTPDSTKQLKISNFIVKINSEINNSRQAGKYNLPDSFVNLFDTSKVNFIFCTYNEGYIRNRKNLVNTYQKSEIADFLIGYSRRPLESSALMSCFIIDLRQKNILYFERDIWENRDPTEAHFIKLQLTKIINHYFM